MDRFLYKIIVFFFSLIRRTPSDRLVEELIKFIKFGIVGVSNTVLSYVLNILSLFLFQRMGVSPKVDYLLAIAVAFILSVFWSFLWNNKYVFTKGEGEKRVWWKTLIKTYIAYSFTGIFLSSVLSYIWINIFHISKVIAPLINLVISVPVNFIINRFWAFKTE